MTTAAIGLRDFGQESCGGPYMLLGKRVDESARTAHAYAGLTCGMEALLDLAIGSLKRDPWR